MLEFAYIDVLGDAIARRQGSNIPNLELYVEEHPDLFVQVIAWTFRRKDKVEDLPEMKAPAGHEKQYAERGYKLLDTLHRIPGHDKSGELRAENLTAWISKVRAACADIGRLEIADVHIGILLSSAPPRKDGGWPCAPVLDVLEEFQSVAMTEGARTGLINSVGATWRGEGVDQERTKAAKYRSWAAAVQFSHPFVASNLFAALADTYEHYAKREDTDAGVRQRLET